MRLDVTSSACLKTASGEEFWCQTDSLSRLELVVQCTLDSLMRILPKGHLTPNLKVRIDVSLYLPRPGQTASGKSPQGPDVLHTNMGVRATRRISRDCFLLYLRIDELSLHEISTLETYIADRKQQLTH